MIAVITKYLDPTKTLGPRIKADSGYYSVTIHLPSDCYTSSIKQHYDAVKVLAERHYPTWDVSTMVYGTTMGKRYNEIFFCFPSSKIEDTQDDDR